jgi:hypothetical protein
MLDQTTKLFSDLLDLVAEASRIDDVSSC